MFWNSTSFSLNSLIFHCLSFSNFLERNSLIRALFFSFSLMSFSNCSCSIYLTSNSSAFSLLTSSFYFRIWFLLTFANSHSRYTYTFVRISSPYSSSRARVYSSFYSSIASNFCTSSTFRLKSFSFCSFCFSRFTLARCWLSLFTFSYFSASAVCAISLSSSTMRSSNCCLASLSVSFYTLAWFNCHFFSSLFFFSFASLVSMSLILSRRSSIRVFISECLACNSEISSMPNFCWFISEICLDWSSSLTLICSSRFFFSSFSSFSCLI